MKLSFHPKADMDKLLDNMADHEERSSEPGWGYIRWIDEEEHWQFVDQFLNEYDWDNIPTVIYRYADGDTEIFSDDYTIADEMLQAGKEVLSEEAYEMLEWIDYATELDDAISNYIHWKGHDYTLLTNDRTRIDLRMEQYLDGSPATPEEAKRQADNRAHFKEMQDMIRAGKVKFA